MALALFAMEQAFNGVFKILFPIGREPRSLHCGSVSNFAQFSASVLT